MKTVTKNILLAGIAALSFGVVSAQASDMLVVNNEQEIKIHAPANGLSALPELFSGWVFRAKETQALQADDFDNPGMIFVDKGMDLWTKAEGDAGKSCADCHGDPSSMAGLRASMPKWNKAKGKLYTLEDYINESRVTHMGAKPWKWSGEQMQSVIGLIALQSRGMPIDVKTDGPAHDMWAKGKEIYYTRVGQLDMACSNCHEDNYGKMIRADRLSQGQINGFPAYRLKNGKLNSVHARFKGCMKNIRATPYKEGSDEFRALQLYVASRGNGLSVEGPSVRN